jgi:hypothetical protein
MTPADDGVLRGEAAERLFHRTWPAAAREAARIVNETMSPPSLEIGVALLMLRAAEQMLLRAAKENSRAFLSAQLAELLPFIEQHLVSVPATAGVPNVSLLTVPVPRTKPD